MKETVFAEESFILEPSGLLLWPAQKIAIVSDLHLEKGSFFAAKGQLLPPHDSEQTLKKLYKALEFSGVQKVVFLGDSFHDNAGYARLNNKTRQVFEHILQTYQSIWIKGNHDDQFFPKNIDVYDELKIDQIMFRHEADANSTDFEISGHYHPKASVKLSGRKINKPCFVQSDQRVIMPAYGAYTGGLNIDDEVFLPFLSESYTIHLLGKNNIYSVPYKK